jgi:hypothetical protein
VDTILTVTASGSRWDYRTLTLFIYYGGANAFAYVSERLLKALGKSEDELELEDLLNDIQLDDTVVFEADDEWNGVNYFGFAPLAD